MSASAERNSSSLRGGLPLRLQIECNFAAVRRCAAQVRAFLVASGLNERDVWACELAFVEGCNNAVQHTPASRIGKKLLVEMACSGGHVELRINDFTAGFECPEAASLPPAEAESGRGIYLMRTLMDHVDYVRESASNCLILRKSVTGI